MSLFRFVVAMVLINMANLSLAQSAQEQWPPFEYSLNQLRISATVFAGHSIHPARTVTIKGNGMCVLTQSDEELACQALNRKELMSLVNQFYQARFFDMKSSRSARRQVSADADGLVRTFAENMLDTGSRRVCFEVGSFKKCVVAILGTPHEAEALAHRIMERAELKK